MKFNIPLRLSILHIDTYPNPKLTLLNNPPKKNSLLLNNALLRFSCKGFSSSAINSIKFSLRAQTVACPLTGSCPEIRNAQNRMNYFYFTIDSQKLERLTCKLYLTSSWITKLCLNNLL